MTANDKNWRLTMTFLDKARNTIDRKKEDPGPPAYVALINSRDYAAALPLLRAAMGMEDARAMGAYAAMCATGNGVEKNLEEAYAWFLQAANRGDIPSQVALGMCLASGKGVAVNRLEGAFWLYRASKSGSVRAMKGLRDLTEKDRSVIGPHFSEDELNAMCYQLIKLESIQPVTASRSLH